MIRQVKGIGATGLLLVAVLYHPGIVAAHGGADIEEDPCMRLAGEIMADVRPSTHPDGVLRSKVNLEEGLYRVIIASEKQNLLRRPQYVLRVHMVDYQKLVLSFAGPLIAL